MLGGGGGGLDGFCVSFKTRFSPLKMCFPRSADACSIPHLDWIIEKKREREQCGRVQPWLPDQAIPTRAYTHTHTHLRSRHKSSWNILVDGTVWKEDVALVFQRFCQISHKSLQHENWRRIKNYTYITENKNSLKITLITGLRSDDWRIKVGAC